MKVVGEMEIIPGLNVKQSVSCSYMNHQFYISLKFCMQLTGDVNKMISSCCVGTSNMNILSVLQATSLFSFWIYINVTNIEI